MAAATEHNPQRKGNGQEETPASELDGNGSTSERYKRRLWHRRQAEKKAATQTRWQRQLGVPQPPSPLLHQCASHLKYSWIRRSSYHDVILVSEIEKLMDIRGVQTYITNSTRVVFLKGRLRPSSGKGVKYGCHTCHKALLSTYSFCSLGCKLTGTKLNGEIKAKAKANQQRQKQQDRNAIESFFFQDDSADILDYNTSPLPPSTVNHTASTRRRNGIPHRAPLGNEFQ